jgi:hypothetical protein
MTTDATDRSTFNMQTLEQHFGQRIKVSRMNKLIIRRMKLESILLTAAAANNAVNSVNTRQ